MCNGHNHKPGCGCGFGGEGHAGAGGSHYVPIKVRVARPVIFPTTVATWSYPSYVDPNAVCPVCKAPVFFYQSPSGGRVFFDEMGPPWPKHPCTDSVLTIEIGSDSQPPPLLLEKPDSSTHRPLFNWQKQDWEVFVCEKLIENKDDLTIKVMGKLAATSTPLDLFVSPSNMSFSMDVLEHVHIKRVCPRAGRFVFEAAYIRQGLFDKVGRIDTLRLTAYTTLRAWDFYWADSCWVDNLGPRYIDMRFRLSALTTWFIRTPDLPDTTFTLPSGAVVKNPSNYYDGLHVSIEREPKENVVPYARKLIKKLSDLHRYVKLHKGY